MLPGPALAALPGAVVIDGLGQPVGVNAAATESAHRVSPG